MPGRRHRLTQSTIKFSNKPEIASTARDKDGSGDGTTADAPVVIADSDTADTIATDTDTDIEFIGFETTPSRPTVVETPERQIGSGCRKGKKVQSRIPEWKPVPPSTAGYGSSPRSIVHSSQVGNAFLSPQKRRAGSRLDESDSSTNTDESLVRMPRSTPRKRSRTIKSDEDEDEDEDEGAGGGTPSAARTSSPPGDHPGGRRGEHSAASEKDEEEDDSDDDSGDSESDDVVPSSRRKNRLSRKNTALASLLSRDDGRGDDGDGEDDNGDDDSDDDESDDSDTPGYTFGSSTRKTRSAALARLRKYRENGKTELEPNLPSSKWDDSYSRHGQPGPSTAELLYNVYSDDEKFVVSDEDVKAGDDKTATSSAVPLQFTALASARASDLFEFAVEWMVLRHLFPVRFDPVHRNGGARDGSRPVSEMSDEHRLAFRKLDDEVKGMAGSKFISSVWRSDFRRTLLSRPEIVVIQDQAVADPGFLSSGCDACGRSNHPARCIICFQGAPYDAETLEELDQSSLAGGKSDDSDDDHSPSPVRSGQERDSHGHVLPSSSKEFNLGRFCLYNAETAHRLIHWRYHLAEAVTMQLCRIGYEPAHGFIPVQQQPSTLLPEIMEELNNNGGMKRLYREWKLVLNNARYNVNRPQLRA